MTNKIISIYAVIFGLQTIKLKHKMAAGVIFCYNRLLPFLHISTSLISATFYELQASYLQVCLKQNPVTISSFWCQYYGRVIVSCCMVASTISKKKEIALVHSELEALENLTANYGRRLVINTQLTYFILLTLSVSAPAFIIADCLLSSTNRNFASIWSAYLPGCVIIVYTVYFSHLKKRIGAVFKVLNDFLEDYKERLSLDEVLGEALLGFPHKLRLDEAILYRLFKLHNRAYECAIKLNEIYGKCYLYYLILTLHGLMLLFYTIALIGIRFRAGRGFQKYEHTFTEYWSSMNLIALFGVVFISHELNERCNVTIKILKRVARVYAQVNEQISIYLYQLISTELRTNAAGFFKLDYSTLMIVIGLSAKYIFVMIQFDVGKWSLKSELGRLMNATNITIFA